MTDQIRQQFTAALDALVHEVRKDRSILAAVLCGSLSHDTVWAKSDIDLVVVTVDDKQLKPRDLCLNADGVNVHVVPFTRTALREAVEGARHSSFLHSYLAKGRLLYTHDDTIGSLLERLQVLGERDMQIELLRAATDVVPAVYKAHKWMITRGDLEYTSLWLLYAAMGLARVELIAARKLTDREALPQALALNPALFQTIYVDLLNVPEDPCERHGSARRGRRLLERARDTTVPAGAALPEGRGRGPIGHRDRRALQAELRHRQRRDGVRIPRGSGPPRQGVPAGAPHPQEQRRGAGDGLLRYR